MNTEGITTTGLHAPGWEASWLNGWLAALGVIRSTDLRLSFTRCANPIPSFTTANGTVAEWVDVADALPSTEAIKQLSIARNVDGLDEFPRKPGLTSFAHRAEGARASADRSLGATVTDLVSDAELGHSTFDVAVPKGITVWQRLLACRELIDDDSAIERSGRGELRRVNTNGLGFDARRIAIATAPDPSKTVDPVVECLAFAAVEMFPVRGDGSVAPRVRGWSGRPSQRSAFVWPVWSDPLSWAAVDSLLDEFAELRPSDPAIEMTHFWAKPASRLSVFGAFGSVPYRWTSSMDSTRAYSSDELWMNL